MSEELNLTMTEKQKRFILDLGEIDEVLYGGQAGGGKSEGLLLFALLRRLQYPGSVGLMLRRTFRELDKSLIRKSKFAQAWSKQAKWNEEKKCWFFKNGSIQEFGYCETDNDLLQYQSAEYDDCCFDELTHFPEQHYHYLKSRLRPRSCPKGLMRSATNPGNVGHLWVREYFVTPAKDRIYKERDEDGREMTRYFLPASLDDNTLMSENERGNYRSWLNQLPEVERRRLRDGDWDYVPGAAFPEWNSMIHVVPDFPVPDFARIYMSFDFGFGKPFSVGWWWTDFDGRAYRFGEWYGWNGKANEGLRMPASAIARGIKEREVAMKLDKRIYRRIADPSIFAKTPNLRGGGQGPSVAEMMRDEGLIMEPGDNDRFQGKQQMHERLKVAEDGLPLIQIYSSCTAFLRTVPVLPLVPPDKGEDIDTDTEDHVWDECRYFLMSRPVVPRKPKPEKERYWDNKPRRTLSWMAR